MKRKISVYLRNQNIHPSGYYRIYQYFREMDNANIRYRELVSDSIYKKYHFECNLFHKIIYTLDILFKSIWDMTCDILFYKPDIVIINREICPKFQSKIHYFLEKKLLKELMLFGILMMLF